MEEPDAGSLGMAFEGRPFQAYNEHAFRYFLGIERNRAERSQRSSLLVLVNLKRESELSPQIAPSVAAKIFAGLSLCVREVDFVGWHRENRVAGQCWRRDRTFPIPKGPGVSADVSPRSLASSCRRTSRNDCTFAWCR
jgi:hypothetical protein